jgi:hypothetical protein
VALKDLVKVMGKDLFLISHETKTAVQAGVNAAGIPDLRKDRLGALNAFLTINHKNNIMPVWDDDDEFEEILDTYTFITEEDARNSIYNKNSFG